MKSWELKWHESKRKLMDLIDTYKIPLNQIAVSFSGGKDSTLLLRLIDECGLKNKVKVVFFNTNMEYEATYRFIELLKSQGWEIQQTQPKLPAPLIYKKYGVPVQSKQTSEFINRLQKHNFDFVNDTFKPIEELRIKYHNCQMALNWLTGQNITINCPKWLKQKLSQGVDFKIANRCCEFLKKKPVKDFNKEHNIILSIIGVRSAEGGARKYAYKSCMDLKDKNNMRYYPLLDFSDEEVWDIIKDKQVKLSDCYEVYGLTRTGCVGCPFSKNYKQELEILKKYEPNKYIACINLFKNSYNFKK